MLCDMGRFRYVLCEDSNEDSDRVCVGTVIRTQIGSVLGQ